MDLLEVVNGSKKLIDVRHSTLICTHQYQALSVFLIMSKVAVLSELPVHRIRVWPSKMLIGREIRDSFRTTSGIRFEQFIRYQRIISTQDGRRI